MNKWEEEDYLSDIIDFIRWNKQWSLKSIEDEDGIEYWEIYRFTGIEYKTIEVIGGYQTFNELSKAIDEKYDVFGNKK